MYPADLKYSKDHEWIRVEGNRGRVGITHYAQETLGDVVYVDLPRVGDMVKAGESFGTVESVKSVSDLYAPVSGEVVEVNREVMDHPDLINKDPYGGGWLIIIEMSDPGELDNLMDARAYEEMVKEG
ncbi:glycine cleavage system protein GcvH [Desulfofundulus thermocisternus]|jgi:glycine cleavage system H protein|uniref:glycine cleavage system protein GcvH n=1 Tax=Desulfofundulus thermocisternus TaxID=42471 RepID=UPI0019DFCC80|nr:glycine cleavage system protein GcvH [Desulfofundulus thermocisternus]MBE3586518.1 glycine cleavage system protein GcvH [Thermoanaerobacter sp.]MCS5697246.1 glycine cleavage system protein GcvH [Desulfofundulus thermocisternus]